MMFSRLRRNVTVTFVVIAIVLTIAFAVFAILGE